MKITCRKLLQLLICFAPLLLPSVSGAALLAFHVDVNTAPLVGNSAGPFSLDFQLIDGSGTLAVPNTVTLSNFTYGGGGAVGLPTLSPGATGSLTSTISLI